MQELTWMSAMKRLFLAAYLGNLIIVIIFWIIAAGPSLIVTSPLPLKNWGPFWWSLGRLFGLVGMSLVLFQLVLIGRLKWLEGRYGFDSMERLHQENGRIGLSMLVMHPLFLIIGNSLNTGEDFGTSFLAIVQQFPLTILSFAGIILLTCIVLTSNPLVIKRFSYEKWYGLHVFNYFMFSLVFLHQFMYGIDFYTIPAFMVYWLALYIFAIGNFLAFRWIKPFRLRARHHFFIETVKPETHDTVSLVVSGEHMNQFRFQAGQFVLLRVLTKGFKWQVHPFSISALPDGEHVRFTVKALGDYTEKLVKIEPGVQLMMDGPLGVFTAAASKKPKSLLIAAGSGITPIRSLAEQLAKDRPGQDMVLVYGNKTMDDIIFHDELASLSAQYNFPIHHFLSRENRDEDGYHQGRMSIPEIAKIVPDYLEREVFMCAPQQMMRSLKKDLIQSGIPKASIYGEEFAW
ncbi:MAG TPA: ferredoxin reductase family protein [Candidatus Lokiarchaeia archaeon]|nr:ferredoxin reductase family protein [Candidatus Lokiarchaeia archaeon]